MFPAASSCQLSPLLVLEVLEHFSISYSQGPICRFTRPTQANQLTVSIKYALPASISISFPIQCFTCFIFIYSMFQQPIFHGNCCYMVASKCLSGQCSKIIT